MTEKDLAATLATNTARLMAKMKWSAAELARKLETHQSNVGRLLKGHYAPSAKTITAVANVFGVELCELLCPTKAKKRSG